MKAAFALVVLALLAVNTVQGLDCIICDNCGELGDQKAIACDGENNDITLPPNFPKPENDEDGTGEPDENEGGTGGADENKDPKKKLIHKYLRADEYKCFKYSIKWGSGLLVKRGCTKQKDCTEITSAYDKDLVTDCNVCDDEAGCNPASNIKSWAFSSVILMAIIKMFM